MTAATIVRSVALFVLAGLMEIGGGHLVWLWLREGRAVFLGAAGGLLLLLYGVVPTLQPAHTSAASTPRMAACSWCSRCSGAGGSTGALRTAPTPLALRSAPSACW